MSDQITPKYDASIYPPKSFVEVMADNARNWAGEVRSYEERILEGQRNATFRREQIGKLERPYRLAVYDGKTADIQDAQREDDMAEDTDIQRHRELLREEEQLLAVARVERDAAERLYKISLAELRTYGVER